MAGIGFELKRHTPQASLWGHACTFSFAAVIASGPWIFSIITLLLMTVISLQAGLANDAVQQFLVTNTYLVALAQILCSGFQLVITRYTADLIYVKNYRDVFSHVLGGIITVSGLAVPIGLFLTIGLSEMPVAFRALSALALPVYCALWMSILFLSSVKAYRKIVTALLLSYGCIVLQVLLVPPHSPTQLLLAFVTGHIIAVFLFLVLIWRSYPSVLNLSFSALAPTPTTQRLMLCGILYNLAIWSDKFIFWMTPELSKPITSWFRSSLIYDLPIFLSNLVIIPGLAVFLLSTETDFAEKCREYFKHLNADATLNELFELKEAVISSYRSGLMLLCKVQLIACAFLIAYSEPVFNAFHIELIYRPIFCVDLVGMSFLMLLMSQINTLFYLNQLRMVLSLTVFFLVSNTVLTVLSLEAGIQFYGYGFTVAALLTTVFGFHLLNRALTHLERMSLMQYAS